MPSGDYVTLNCKARGRKPINYRWYKNGKRLMSRRTDSSLVTDQSELTLRSLVASDSASYTCKVTNIVDSIEHSFSLVVQGKNKSYVYYDTGNGIPNVTKRL